ncbi:MAG TPA: hypothetical protein VH394_15930, partial [Thermoanaerobaculia bacterium]|nr:hypothetical protein [Thermoanaerobaculia bacterium]
VASRVFPPDGHLEQILRPEDIGILSVFERRDGLECVVSRSDASVTISFGTGSVSGPLGISPAFEYIRDHKRFRLSDLPVRLDDKSKTVLARKLVKGGLLRVCGQAEELEPAGRGPAAKASE